MITSNGLIQIHTPEVDGGKWRAEFHPPDGTAPIGAYGRSDLHAAMCLADVLGHALFHRPDLP